MTPSWSGCARWGDAPGMAAGAAETPMVIFIAQAAARFFEPT
jgi:hypothetical protein